MAPIKLIFTALIMVVMTAVTAQAGDAAKGEKVFKRCKACHYVDKDKNKTGPSLLNVMGRTAGGLESYTKYSKAMVAAGEGGLIWDDASMTEYLRKPKAFIKGTKMAFAGLKKDDQIADVIAYLYQFSE
ncbi:MAG: cytochrome c family protein [Alphaproteobacteria bacterium]|nr:cytochrome c family protein [Alphaproteobacteria bacterium]